MSRPGRENLDFCKLELAADLLQSGVPIRSRCCGSSMIPALWPGDLLIIEPVKAETLSVGDIVVAAQGKCLVSHRLIWHGKLDGAPCWITRGDSVRLTDSPIVSQQIVGQVSRIERRGKILALGRSPTLIHSIVGWMIARSDLSRVLALRMYRGYQITGANHPDSLADPESFSAIPGALD